MTTKPLLLLLLLFVGALLCVAADIDDEENHLKHHKHHHHHHHKHHPPGGRFLLQSEPDLVKDSHRLPPKQKQHPHDGGSHMLSEQAKYEKKPSLENRETKGHNGHKKPPPA